MGDNGLAQVATTEITSTDMKAPEMRQRLTDMKERISLVQSFFKEIMQENEDYGVIPGTQKPTLLKPGAEKLCEFYGYSIQVQVDREDKDRDTGYYDCAVTVRLVSKRTGEVIAEGVGEANTYEGRYRWREAGRSYQFKDNPQEWEKIKQSAARVIQKTGKYGPYDVAYKENDDFWSLWNTIKKMAKKRALVDAALSATRSSGLFTQDMEDLQEWANAGDVIDVDAEIIDETKSKPEGSNDGRSGNNHRGNGDAGRQSQHQDAVPPVTMTDVQSLLQDAKSSGHTDETIMAAFKEVTGRTTLKGWSGDRHEFYQWKTKLEAAAASAQASQQSGEGGGMDYDDVPF